MGYPKILFCFLWCILYRELYGQSLETTINPSPSSVEWFDNSMNATESLSYAVVVTASVSTGESNGGENGGGGGNGGDSMVETSSTTRTLTHDTISRRPDGEEGTTNSATATTTTTGNSQTATATTGGAGPGNGQTASTATGGTGPGNSQTTGQAVTTTSTTTGHGHMGTTTSMTHAQGEGPPTTRTPAIQPSAATTTWPMASYSVAMTHAPEPPRVRININITLNGDLNNFTAAERASLKANLTNALCSPLQQTYGDRLTDCQVILSNGTVAGAVLKLVVTANSTADVNITMLLDTVRTRLNASSEALGGLTFRGLSYTLASLVQPTVATTPVVRATDEPEDDGGLEGWKIALIVCLVIVLVGVILFVGALIFYKKRSEELKNEAEDNDVPMGTHNPGAQYEDMAEQRV